jgi:PAS domain S-box-containing protein
MSQEQDHTETPSFSMHGISKALFDAAAEGLIVVDMQGAIVLVNKRSEEMLGYDNGELIGMAIETLVPHRFSSHLRHRNDYLQAPARRSMGIGLDLTALRKDGSEFPVEISLNHFVVDGERYIMALLSDITRRKEAEHALEKLNEDLELRVEKRTRDLAESQHLYEVIARNFPNGAIMVFDRAFDYVFAEGRELYKLGVTSQELLGSNYLARLSPEARAIVEPQLSKAFEGHSVNFDIVEQDKHYELQAVPLRDRDWVVTRILVVETNVTPQKRAEQNIRQALEKERQLNELKSRFVSMASHEFRTPLSTILTSLSLAARYHGPGQEANLQKHYSRIRNSVHNLTGILNDFLSLDKLESGLIATNPVPLNLRAILADLVDEMQTICKDGQTIAVDFQGDEQVVCDQHMLRNILLNLISNASKYSEENKPIEVLVQAKDAKVLIQVRDHGIGIPEAEQRHMFGRFFRAQNAMNIQGTGLGLSIVKKYVDIMGGDIWFESTHGQGSTFSFVIPKNQVI